jgi:hypothetical protein
LYIYDMKAARILFVILTLSLYSCEYLMGGLTIRADKGTFEKERNLWNKQNLKNYKFTYEYFNDAGPVGPIKFVVKENEEPEMTISDVYNSISRTFDYIESVKNGTYDDGGYVVTSITLDISYDARYHYPTKVDLSTGYAIQVDGGAYYTIKITDFSTLQQ